MNSLSRRLPWPSLIPPVNKVLLVYVLSCQMQTSFQGMCIAEEEPRRRLISLATRRAGAQVVPKPPAIRGRVGPVRLRYRPAPVVVGVCGCRAAFGHGCQLVCVIVREGGGFPLSSPFNGRKISERLKVIRKDVREAAKRFHRSPPGALREGAHHARQAALGERRDDGRRHR